MSNPSLGPIPTLATPDAAAASPRNPVVGFARIVSRLLLGGSYVYLGFVKVADPVGFLKAIRQYDIVQTPPFLNLIAALLPWVEISCGLALLAGIAVRGAALVSLGMLVPFTSLVVRRALQLQAAGALPFCGVRFDCGCGAGEIGICHKLVENGVLCLLSVWLLLRAARPRPSTTPNRSPAPS